MRYFLISFVMVAFVIMQGCSKNENDPISSEKETETLSLSVTAGETYYINLNQTQTMEVSDNLLQSDWDIAIDNLTRVKLNGGSTAPGNVFATRVENLEYNDLKTAPSVMYDTDTQMDYVIGENWYYYDFSTHTVNPLDVFYVIKAVNDDYYKFRITESNFTSRTDGERKIQFEKINSPSAPEFLPSNGRVQLFKLPLSSSQATYFSFNASNLVAVSDEQSSISWDIKTEFVTIFLNGGSSGPGQAGAQLLHDSVFDSIDAAPETGYMQDDVNNGGAIGDSWYTYDFMTHTLSANPYVYIIKTANGNHAKLEFIKTDFSGQDAGIAVVRFQYIEGTLQF